MDLKVLTYLAYLTISIGLTVWVARTLSRNGEVFLEEVFADQRLAKAVNHLLVVGFYLLNLGYVTVAMRTDEQLGSLSQALENLSWKIGLVLLVLGVLHFFNVFALNRYRRGRLRQYGGQPPLPPVGRLPIMMPPGAVPPPGAVLPGAVPPSDAVPPPHAPAGPPPARA